MNISYSDRKMKIKNYKKKKADTAGDMEAIFTKPT
jgi:hypothetical protein